MKPNEQANKTVEAWQVSAKYWDKYRDLIAQMFAPLTAGLIKEAGIAAGDKVLDIGGGSGEPSLTISGIVGSTGSVMYTDPAVGMLQSAQAEAGRQSLTNIQFRQCSGDGLPFADDTFDVAVGRLSAMFFPNPLAGVREVLRAVRPDGKVAFVVWGPAEANPFLSGVTTMVERFVKLPAADDPDAPDAFRFAVPGKFAGIVKDAGGEKVTERVLDFQIEGDIAFDQFWQMRTEMSDTLRQSLARLTDSELAMVRQSVADTVEGYFAGGKMSFPARALIVCGRKPLKTKSRDAENLRN